VLQSTRLVSLGARLNTALGVRDMKQEQRLVAEVYRYLAPFIDTSRDIYLSLDGQAALVGVGQGRFVDGTIPDLWFTLIGRANPTLIEAKAFDAKGRVLLMQSQLQAWRTSGAGGHRPSYWIGVSNSFDTFFLWKHSDFLLALDNSQNKQDTVTLAPPPQRQEFGTINQLALAILCSL
jgi:hypothetical protein